jgi:adenylate cyclase class 2
MPKNIEIEIQVQLENIRPLKSFLNKKAKFLHQSRQIDYYYTPVHRNFLAKYPAVEWLRLRETDKECSINYKFWHVDEEDRSHYSDEYESAISDIDQLKLILKALNFKPIAVVDKKRQDYKYHSYIISVCQVKKLGEFVEIEFEGRANKKPAEITDEMIKFLKDLGVGKITRNYNGYPFILLFPKKVKYEEF